VLTRNMKSQKYTIYMSVTAYNQVYHAKVVCFLIFGLVVGAEFFAEQKFFWTSLRLFVKENYLRSRRAPCADTKHKTVRNVSFLFK